MRRATCSSRRLPRQGAEPWPESTSTSPTPTSASDVDLTNVAQNAIDAAALGFKRTATTRLLGGTPVENARITEAVLRGEPGIRRDVVVLNAAAALLVAGVVAAMEEGIERAALTIDAGLGVELLQALREERRTAEAAVPTTEGQPSRRSPRGDAPISRPRSPG